MNERDMPSYFRKPRKPVAPQPVSPIRETKADNSLHGVELLRKAAKLSTVTRESTWDGLTALEVLTVCVTVLQCGWDVTPCDLTDDEWDLALAGKVAPLGEALRARSDAGKL